MQKDAQERSAETIPNVSSCALNFRCNTAGRLSTRDLIAASRSRVEIGARGNEGNDVARGVLGHEMFRNLNSKLGNLFVRERNLSALRETRLCWRRDSTGDVISLRFSLLQIQVYGFNAELYHNMSEAQHKSQGLVAISLMVQVSEFLSSDAPDKTFVHFSNVPGP